MAATTYRQKRRARKHTSRLPTGSRPPDEATRLIALGTVACLVPEGIPYAQGPELSVRVAGRYDIQVGPSFQPHVLARLVRTLEQLA